MFVVVGGLMLAYEATTFDLLPWGASAVVDPSAPVPGARLEFSPPRTARARRPHQASRSARASPRRTIRFCPSAASSTWRPTTSDTTASTRSWIPARGAGTAARSLHVELPRGAGVRPQAIQVTVLRLGWNPQASTPEPDRSPVPAARAGTSRDPTGSGAAADRRRTAGGRHVGERRDEGPTAKSTPAPVHEPTSSGSADSVSAPTPLP